jgi:hypothetical protein
MIIFLEFFSNQVMSIGPGFLRKRGLQGRLELFSAALRHGAGCATLGFEVILNVSLG